MMRKNGFLLVAALWHLLQRATRARSKKSSDVAHARRRGMREQDLLGPPGWYSSTRRRPTPRWCGFLAVAPAASG
jgi:hypothetical protein